MRATLAVLVLLALPALLAQPGAARAQYVDLTRPDPGALSLMAARRSIHAERREAGVALLVGGLASVVAGAVVAGVGYEDPFALSFGVGTAGWGAINAALSVGLLDLGDGALARLEAEGAELRGDALARARETELRRQHDAATFFALNVGLDVVYVASGILLFFLADQLDGEEESEMLRGYAIAQVAQGGFLFAFDLVEWIGSVDRANRVAAVEVPE